METKQKRGYVKGGCNGCMYQVRATGAARGCSDMHSWDSSSPSDCPIEHYFATPGETKRREENKVIDRKIVATVGKFSWDGESVIGPKGYMEDPQGFGKVKSSLESGKNVIIGAAPTGTNPVALMLVAIQTDYAAWRGYREIEALYSR